MRANEDLRPREVEWRVADSFRSTAWRIVPEAVLGGFRLDLLVYEGPGLAPVAVDVKVAVRKLGTPSVQSFMMVVEHLRRRDLISGAVIVSTSGFTEGARALAARASIELVTYSTLLRKARSDVRPRDAEIEAPRPARTLFVAMPFRPEFTDVYVIGIREVAEKLGLAVERADDIQHDGAIIEVIKERIRSCSALIAEMSEANQNVAYEVGYAHGIGKETVLLAKDAATIPFDTSGLNHIIWDSLVDLRGKLETRLRAVVPGVSA